MALNFGLTSAIGFTTFPNGYGIDKSFDLQGRWVLPDESSILDLNATCFKVLVPTSSPLSKLHLSVGIHSDPSWPDMHLTINIYTINTSGLPSVFLGQSDTITLTAGSGLQQEVAFSFSPGIPLPIGDFVFLYLYVTSDVGPYGYETGQVAVWDSFARVNDYYLSSILDYDQLSHLYRLDGYPFLTVFNRVPVSWWGTTGLFSAKSPGFIGAGLLEFENGVLLGSPWSQTYETTDEAFSIYGASTSESCKIDENVRRGGMIVLPANAKIYSADIKVIFPLLQNPALPDYPIETTSLTAFLYQGNKLITSKTLTRAEIVLPNEKNEARIRWVRFDFDTTPILAAGETYRLVVGANYDYGPYGSSDLDQPVGIPIYKNWDAIEDNRSLRSFAFPYTIQRHEIDWEDHIMNDCGISLILEWITGNSSTGTERDSRRRQNGS